MMHLLRENSASGGDSSNFATFFTSYCFIFYNISLPQA